MIRGANCRYEKVTLTNVISQTFGLLLYKYSKTFFVKVYQFSYISSQGKHIQSGQRQLFIFF